MWENETNICTIIVDFIELNVVLCLSFKIAGKKITK